MKFTKMHGTGNDYIYVNGFEEKGFDYSAVAKVVSHRRFGIGGDGLIAVLPSDVADVKMSMFNADGSEGLMCGNGIRCVGKLAYESGIVGKTDITVETRTGIKRVSLAVSDGLVTEVTVDMGLPGLAPQDIGMDVPDGIVDKLSNWPVRVGTQDYWGTAVSMGNPHWVFFLEDNRRTLASGSDGFFEALEKLDLDRIGPAFENHPYFPQRVNTEFVFTDVDTDDIIMRVFERGSGETFACGTGACAVMVAAILRGRVRREGVVRLKGGDLFVRWDESDGHVYMTGNAVTVFTGEIPYI